MISNNEIEILRTEMKVRVEKRLASLLNELSKDTGKSIGQLLEKIILQSFESVPNQEDRTRGNLFTTETLTALKKKHNIDYNASDVYNFREKASEANIWSRRFTDH